MATPFTGGKAGSNKSGGHTSRGVHTPAMGKNANGKARSNSTTRIGNLKSRTHGAGGKVPGL